MSAAGLFDPRYPGAFRLYLALLVVVDHLFGLHLGLLAVYLFFVLSGFWIHRIWTGRYVAGRYAYPTFIASRLWRLVPVMACAMALAIAVQVLAGGASLGALAERFTPAELLSHVFILGYAQTPGPLILPPAWTLDLELQFYLLAPLLCALLARIGAAPFLALGVGAAIIAPYLDFGPPVLPFLVLFMAGMTVSATDWRPSRAWQAGALAVAGTIIVALVAGGQGAVFFQPGETPATYRLNWLLAIVLAPAAIATVWRHNPDPRDAMLGDLSYISYLLHWPLLMAMIALQPLLSPALALLLFAASLAAGSLAVWRFVDRPLNDWRGRVVARLTARRARAAEAAAARSPA